MKIQNFIENPSSRTISWIAQIALIRREAVALSETLADGVFEADPDYDLVSEELDAALVSLDEAQKSLSEALRYAICADAYSQVGREELLRRSTAASTEPSDGTEA